MIKANELRIGNKIFYRNKAITVNWQELKWIQEENNNFQPIPLTEEILLKCGFVKDGRWFCLHFGFYSIGIANDESGFNYVWDDGFRTIKYLHQLQNLYFALTNEELTINL
jgi:hypothetical protein